MEFRAPVVAAQENAKALAYLTRNLSDPEAGRECVAGLFHELGNAVGHYPDWHPILTAPAQKTAKHVFSMSQLPVYKDADHRVKFVRGFVACPYSDGEADRLVDGVSKVPGLYAYRLQEPLYADNTFPVVVEATDVELEADGTVRTRDALAWFARQMVDAAPTAQVAETWWSIRSNILGRPYGSRSSLFVNQHAGIHMRKILEAMNNSGMFGPIMESSLEMLSNKKRSSIAENLIRTAVRNWDRESKEFSFELRDEICKVSIRDTWNDGFEISLSVEVGDHDLYVTGFYYPKDDKVDYLEPNGKRDVAVKFI